MVPSYWARKIWEGGDFLILHKCKCPNIAEHCCAIWRMPEGKLWRGIRSTKREKKMLGSAVVTDGEMVGCSQMETHWRVSLLQSGQLLENRLGAKTSRKPQNSFNVWAVSPGRKESVSISLSSCSGWTCSGSSAGCPWRSIRSSDWNSLCLGWETLMLSTKHGNAMVIIHQCHLEPNQHLLGAFFVDGPGLLLQWWSMQVFPSCLLALLDVTISSGPALAARTEHRAVPFEKVFTRIPQVWTKMRSLGRCVVLQLECCGV